MRTQIAPQIVCIFNFRHSGEYVILSQYEVFFRIIFYENFQAFRKLERTVQLTLT